METGPTGMATSNLTLAGAVMPFVPNDVSNVTLPIIASALTGQNGSAGLPIEFEGGVSAVLQSVGPITFGGVIQMQADASASPRFDAVYSPPGSSGSSAPLQVRMSVLGTYVKGSIGPLPPDVQVSFPQQPLELPPNSLVYFNFDVTNTLKPSNSSVVDTYTYTLAVQEKVDNATYVEPLTVSVSTGENTIFWGAGATTPGAAPGGPASTTTSSSHTANAPGFQGVEVALALATLALVATVAVVLGLERRVRPAALPVESNVGTHAPSVIEVCSIGFNSHRRPPIPMDDGENRCRFVPRSPGGGCPGRGLSGRELGAAGQHLDIDCDNNGQQHRHHELQHVRRCRNLLEYRDRDHHGDRDLHYAGLPGHDDLCCTDQL